jgi:UDP:flavonoid glycosyltransferase YjiC (YdhE family)
MRVLVASTGGAGHFNPLMPFIEAFTRRGDDVVVVVPPSLAETAEATGQRVVVGAKPPKDELEPIWQRVPTVSPAEAAVLVNREIFGRLCTAAMLPAMVDACQRWQPDLIVREPCEFASAVAAVRFDLPQAQVGISPAEVEASSLAMAEPTLGGAVIARIMDSPYLTRFPASLDPSPFVVTRRFRDVSGSVAAPLPDWWGGDAAPLVYVTLGSITGRLPSATAAYRAVLEAVADEPVRVLLTVGRSFDVSGLGPMPANVHATDWVPQSDVLPAADVVVCHGGSGTTFGALAAGVPLVVMPMFADQPANGRLVTSAGAGVVVSPTRADKMGAFAVADVPRIRTAIRSVLSEPTYRTSATRISEEMANTPTVPEVITTLPSGWAA